MPQTKIFCTKCGREHATYKEASHCEQTDMAMQAGASQMLRNVDKDDMRQVVHAIIVMLGNAGYINPAVNPDGPYRAPSPPEEPAHGHPEPGT